ncbi:MAG: AMP-binding protein [Acidobacteriia bacterium]|nr:AMP-binding protein [Methyloceanibacter sp.]MCL6492024.1 AMP-binding protein [Terriglobia bacterium]
MAGSVTEFALPLHGVSEPRPAFSSLCAMFAHAVATVPEVVALRGAGASLTYREEGRAVDALARRLAALAAPGEVVALLLPNSIAFRISYFAALKALAVPALLNPLYRALELERLLREVNPRVLLCGETTQALAHELAAKLGIPAVLGFGAELSVTALAAEPAAPLNRREAGAEDLGVLLFSGGTTGLPKAVPQTHGRLLIAVRCVDYSWPTRAQGEVWLPIAPFTHVYGFLQGLLSPVYSRAEVIIPERFKPELIVELLARHRVTVFGGGPPAVYAALLNAANLAGADFSALRVCPAGGAPMPVELLQRWQNATGCVIHEGYGMTEMAPISGTTDLSGVRPGSVGKPIPCNEVQIVDLETGTRVLKAGETGEVRVRGPHMMRGYYNRPEETAKVLRDGFIYTGDIGRMDADGFLYITDRKKDVILVKGFNVFPREVEEVIHTHPKVAAAGVVGVPDARTGERVIAYVVPRPEEALDADELAVYIAERLAAYKCPAVIRIVTALPMTGAQKLDRMALRAQALGDE